MSNTASTEVNDTDVATFRVFRWDEQEKESGVSPLVVASKIHGTQTTILRADIKAGFVMAAHSHPQEQITLVQSGRLRVWSETHPEGAVVGPGGVARVPGGMTHGAEALEDVVAFDVFSPRRP